MSHPGPDADPTVPAVAAAPAPLWLDGDPGFDDWLALLLLRALPPRWRLGGFSLVAGNAPLAQVLDNAQRIRALHGLRLPLHAGAARPLVAEPVHAAYVLGPQGLRSTGRPLPPAPPGAAQQPGDSADAPGALCAWLRAHPGATVLATGPLTNLALALQRDRGAFDAVAEVVFMGGSTDRGNHTPAAEFNIAADPEAADAVLRSGLPLRMFGLNLCRQLGLTQAPVQALRAWPGEPAAVLAGHLDAYQRIASADGSRPMALYDPAPALWLHRPRAFGFQAAPVDVELHGRFTRGMTVVDLRNRDGRPATVQVALSVQADAVLAALLPLLRQALGLAPAPPAGR